MGYLGVLGGFGGFQRRILRVPKEILGVLSGFLGALNVVVGVPVGCWGLGKVAGTEGHFGDPGKILGDHECIFGVPRGDFGVSRRGFLGF